MPISNKNRKVWYEQIIAFIIPLSLYFCFTNFVFLSAVGSLTIIVLPFFVTKDRHYLLQNTARKILITILTYFTLCIFSILITHPDLLINLDFYRRDGNVFITYLPLIVLICTAIDFDIWKIIKRFVYISTIASVVAIVLYYLKVLPGYPEYHMLFVAHNAAGGFLGMLCIANIVFVFHRKIKTIPFLCLVINLFSLYLTNSRGSIFPLVGAVLYLLIVKKTRFKNFDIFANLFLFSIMFLFIISIVAVRGEDTLIHVNSFSLPDEFKGSTLDNFISKIGRGGTIIDRLYYMYPRALYLFSSSPIIGTGMGSFNDLPYELMGAHSFVSWNVSEAINSDSHAHNSFFHILAENGLVGFLMILLFLRFVRKYSKTVDDKNISNLIFLGLNFAILSSYTEHRLFTPSEMLPFVYLLGMIISKNNYIKRNQRYVEKCSYS